MGPDPPAPLPMWVFLVKHDDSACEIITALLRKCGYRPARGSCAGRGELGGNGVARGGKCGDEAALLGRAIDMVAAAGKVRRVWATEERRGSRSRERSSV